MNCEICDKEMILKPVPGAGRFPRRLECPEHGYLHAPVQPKVQTPAVDPTPILVIDRVDSKFGNCGGCGQELCRYCHPENQVVTANLIPGGRHTGRRSYDDCGCFKGQCIHTPEQAQSEVENLTGTAISEDDLRRQFGVEKSESTPTIPKSYRQVLNLAPQDIIDFFDVKLGKYDEFTQLDFVVPPSMLEHRINRLKDMVKCSEQYIEGMASRIIKTRRGKNDPLLNEKATREKYKRDENARIARSNAKLSRYRAALRSGKDHTEKIWGWVTTDVYFRNVIGNNPVNGIDLQTYRDVMSLGDPALVKLGETEAEQKETWENITDWENLVIRAAVYHRIRIPRRDLAELLGLDAVLDEGDYIEADTTEDALAIKTGGACYGGQVKSEGYRYTSGKPVPRALSSFDKPLRDLRGDEINSDGDPIYRDMGFESMGRAFRSDDAESYQSD